MAKSSKICDNYICVQNCEDFAICAKLRNLPKIAKIQNCEDYIFSKLRRFRNKLRKLNIYIRNLFKIAKISEFVEGSDDFAKPHIYIFCIIFKNIQVVF